MRGPARKSILASIAVATLLAFALSSGSPANVAIAQVNGNGSYECFPTCSETDGRLLSLSGTERSTIVGGTINVSIEVPPGTTAFEIGVFDGDTGGLWDDPNNSLPLEYELYPDPDRDGATSPVEEANMIDMWSGTEMPDNAWWSYTVTVSENDPAETPEGWYSYRLGVSVPEVMPLQSTTSELTSGFKVRAEGKLGLRPLQFSFEAPYYGNEDGIYYPDSYIIPEPFEVYLGPSSYDGTWEFRFEVPDNAEYVAIWDGDFDRGSNADEATLDTDDPDTPNDEIPPWAVGTQIRYEGVASVEAGDGCQTEQSATGCPADDRHLSPAEPFLDFFRRTPSVEYTVTDPDGNTYYNPNPSGNLEWEQFKIDTSSDCVAGENADFCVDSVPGGEWRVDVNGLDITNLGSWVFTYDTRAQSCPDGKVSGYVRGECICEDIITGDDDDDDDNDNNNNDDNDNGGCGCGGNVKDLTLKYNGRKAGSFKVYQKTPGTRLFHNWLKPGEEFTVHGADENGTLGSGIYVRSGWRTVARFNTSCSEPIGPGTTDGDFEVVAGASQEGGELCPAGSGKSGRRHHAGDDSAPDWGGWWGDDDDDDDNNDDNDDGGTGGAGKCICSDEGPYGIEGVTVTLSGTTLLGEELAATTETDAEGYFEFTHIELGTYEVTVDPTELPDCFECAVDLPGDDDDDDNNDNDDNNNDSDAAGLNSVWQPDPLCCPGDDDDDDDDNDDNNNDNNDSGPGEWIEVDGCFETNTVIRAGDDDDDDNDNNNDSDGAGLDSVWRPEPACCPGDDDDDDDDNDDGGNVICETIAMSDSDDSDGNVTPNSVTVVIKAPECLAPAWFQYGCLCKEWVPVGDDDDDDDNDDNNNHTGGQGCTPGYWKQSQHFDSWVGYSRWDKFSQVFDVSAGSVKLLAALETGGGGIKALNRHAVAALLCAANPDVNYAYTVDEVKAMVRAAYDDGDYETAKDLFETQNEMGCPLN